MIGLTIKMLSIEDVGGGNLQRQMAAMVEKWKLKDNSGRMAKQAITTSLQSFYSDGSPYCLNV